VVEFDDLPLLFGNHFLVQHQPDEFVVTVGQLTAPPLVSPSDRTGGQSEVPIQTLTRIGLTRNRVAELSRSCRRASRSTITDAGRR